MDNFVNYSPEEFNFKNNEKLKKRERISHWTNSQKQNILIALIVLAK